LFEIRVTRVPCWGPLLEVKVMRRASSGPREEDSCQFFAAAIGFAELVMDVTDPTADAPAGLKAKKTNVVLGLIKWASVERGCSACCSHQE